MADGAVTVIVTSTDPEAVVVSLGRLRLVPSGVAVYAGTGGLELDRIGEPELSPLDGARAFVCTAAEAMTS